MSQLRKAKNCKWDINFDVHNPYVVNYALAIEDIDRACNSLTISSSDKNLMSFLGNINPEWTVVRGSISWFGVGYSCDLLKLPNMQLIGWHGKHMYVFNLKDVTFRASTVPFLTGSFRGFIFSEGISSIKL